MGSNSQFVGRLALVAGACALTGVGAWLALRPPPSSAAAPDPREELKALLKEESLHAAFGLVLEAAKAREAAGPPPASPPLSPPLSPPVPAHGSAPDALDRVLGDDAAGVRLKAALAAKRRSGQPLAPDWIVWSAFEIPADDEPDDTQTGPVERLERTLASVPAASYPEERAEILGSAVLAPERSDRARELALKELGTVAGATAALPIQAHQAFLRHSRDRADALEGTVQAIAAQPDPVVRRRIATQLLARDPEQEEPLKERLRRAGVSPIE